MKRARPSPPRAIRRSAFAAWPSCPAPTTTAASRTITATRTSIPACSCRSKPKTALKEIEAIAAVEGVDGIFIGPSDLAADFGHLGNPKHPDVQAAIADAAKRIRAKGKSAGTLSGNADDVEALFELGYNFVAVGSDVGILARNAEALAARFRKK